MENIWCNKLLAATSVTSWFRTRQDLTPPANMILIFPALNSSWALMHGSYMCSGSQGGEVGCGLTARKAWIEGEKKNESHNQPTTGQIKCGSALTA